MSQIESIKRETEALNRLVNRLENTLQDLKEAYERECKALKDDYDARCKVAIDGYMRERANLFGQSEDPIETGGFDQSKAADEEPAAGLRGSHAGPSTAPSSAPEPGVAGSSSRKRRRDPVNDEPVSDHELVGPNSSSRTRDANKPRTIEFGEVFKNGETNYMIVRWPRHSHDPKWYIIACPEHGMTFGDRPIEGGAKHLDSIVHNHMSRERRLCIRHLGIRVLNCTQRLADRNNEAFRSRLRTGKFKPQNHSRDWRRRSSVPNKIPKRNSRSTGQRRRLRDFRRDSEAYAPKPGQLCRVYYDLTKSRKAGKWHAAICLPTGNLSRVGMPGGLSDTPLGKDIPKGYRCKKEASEGGGNPKIIILGWNRSSGVSAARRRYPFLFFDKPVETPAEGPCNIPSQNTFGWVTAKSIEPLSSDGPDPGYNIAAGFPLAQQFHKWLMGLQAQDQVNQGGSAEDPETVQVAAPAKDVEMPDSDSSDEDFDNGSGNSSNSDSSDEIYCKRERHNSTSTDSEGLDSDYDSDEDTGVYDAYGVDNDGSEYVPKGASQQDSRQEPERESSGNTHMSSGNRGQAVSGTTFPASSTPTLLANGEAAERSGTAPPASSHHERVVADSHKMTLSPAGKGARRVPSPPTQEPGSGVWSNLRFGAVDSPARANSVEIVRDSNNPGGNTNGPTTSTLKQPSASRSKLFSDRAAHRDTTHQPLENSEHSALPSSLE